MTEPGRVAVLVVVAWLLSAVALLAARGALVLFLAVLPGTAVALALRALVRQQRAPRSVQPRLPERYRVADDLTQPIAVVVEVAEAEAR